MLYADLDKYFLTSAFFEGFKILVHHPEVFPEVRDKGFVLGPGQELFAAVNAHGNGKIMGEKVVFVPKKMGKSKLNIHAFKITDISYYKKVGLARAFCSFLIRIFLVCLPS